MPIKGPPEYGNGIDQLVEPSLDEFDPPKLKKSAFGRSAAKRTALLGKFLLGLQAFIFVCHYRG
jgi:hypothetical protein